MYMLSLYGGLGPKHKMPLQPILEIFKYIVHFWGGPYIFFPLWPGPRPGRARIFGNVELRQSSPVDIIFQ